MEKILIYGIGSPYRRDDAIGIRITEILQKKITEQNIMIKSGSIDGLAMLDEIMGYDKVIFVDSIKTKDGKTGDIYKIKIDPLKTLPSLTVSHGIDFLTALRTGKQLGYTMPKQIMIFAVEIEDNTSFNEACTEAVQKSIPEVVERIMSELVRA